ncbi:MAG: ankyrin repeat domain-containing protein [Synechococcales bacterium]|nr:ankyrin repeat domain-containing protein [Synechococcales bacterium]
MNQPLQHLSTSLMMLQAERSPTSIITVLRTLPYYNVLDTAMVMPSSPPQPSVAPLSWYPVSEDIKQLLLLVSHHWHTPEIANRYMQQAIELAGDHPDVLVSAYRYFFYTHNNQLALQVATKVLAMVQQSENLPTDWAELRPILSDRRDDPTLRLYINAYAASGLIRARLGELETAQKIAAQVSEIESRNEFGGKVVQSILENPDDEEMEDNGSGAPAIGTLLQHWLQTQGLNSEDLEQQGYNGETALMLATRAGELEVVRLLVQAGAAINARNHDGNNALWFACFRDRYDLMEQLVKAGIDIDNQNDNGATALMYAASAGKTEMVQHLLALGANAELKNLDDFRAIDFAANFDILRMLKHVVL